MKKRLRNSPGGLSSGCGIRTRDLLVMSQTRYRTSPTRAEKERPERPASSIDGGSIPTSRYNTRVLAPDTAPDPCKDGDRFFTVLPIKNYTMPTQAIASAYMVVKISQQRASTDKPLAKRIKL